MNLKELLNKYDKIEIPMLQRDYAQGRKSQISVANEFLDAIFMVLNDSKQEKTLHIDFIYGYQENNKFLLIDGQQRITTLWLLYFYIYKKAGLLNLIVKKLGKFSYSVRKSSKNFCQNLLNEDFDLLLKPSEAITKNVGAFEDTQNLNNDPTIKAMLNMLDLIHMRVNKNKKDFKKLAKNLDNITFNEFNMDMGDSRLGEELYIKMNARGKQLSRYENLKSFIEKGKIGNDNKLLRTIDNDWSDYFFNSNNVDNFDRKGLNFLHYANIFFKLLNNEAKNSDMKAMIDSTNRVIDDFYKPLQNRENIILLNNVIHLYKNYSEVFAKSNFLKFGDFDSFKNARDSLGYAEICCLYAVLCFVLEYKEKDVDNQMLEDYLRVCRHFIENHRLDKQDEHIVAFFNLFKSLSKGYKNIYEFLVQNPTHSFHSNMYALESRKAKLILQSRNGGDNWEEILNKTSSHHILRGWVDYLLDFCCDDFQSKPVFNIFCRYAEITMQIFNEIQKDKEQSNGFLPLFQRAFLSIGDYGFWATNYFYGNYCGEIFRDREAWNWLLSGKNNRDKIPYFKKLLDNILESKKTNLFDILQYIIDSADISNKEWWEQLLIRQVGLFEFLVENKKIVQKTRRIRFWDKKVELLPAIKSTKNVRDLLDYGFYLYCKDKRIQNLSEYTSDDEQYGDRYSLQSHFAIGNKKVLCDSMNSKITIGRQEFTIEMEGDIFAEFDKIISGITR